MFDRNVRFEVSFCLMLRFMMWLCCIFFVYGIGDIGRDGWLLRECKSVMFLVIFV